MTVSWRSDTRPGNMTALLRFSLVQVLVTSLIALVLTTVPGFATRNELQTPVVDCTCPGDVLTFTCTVNGAGNSTVWNGSSFLCQRGEIIFRPNDFLRRDQCNSDNIHIVAEGISDVDGCYISQLNVTVISMVYNLTVQCAVFDPMLMRVILINVYTISPVADLPPSPNNLQLANVSAQSLLFTWNPVPTECSQLNYILLTNCSTLSCDNQTVSTSTSCSNLNPVVTKTCIFSITPVVCDSAFGSVSAEVTALLRVPQITGVKTVPVYLQSSGALTRLCTTFERPGLFMIADGFSGSPSSYKIVYKNVYGDLCGSADITPASCEDDICIHIFNVSGSSCTVLSILLNVTVSATNLLGEGPTSMPISTSTNNALVVVEYDSASNSILCVFQSTNSHEKACNITFGTCGDNENLMEAVGVPTDDLNFRITLTFQKQKKSQRLCYIVTAKNGNTTIKIEGNVTVDPPQSNNTTIIVVTVPVAIVVAAVILVLVLLFILHRRGLLVFNSCSTCLPGVVPSEPSNSPEVPLSHLPRVVPSGLNNLQKVPEGRFTVLVNDGEECKTKDFLEKKEKPVVKGCSYFEFTGTVPEDIIEGKEIVLMKRGTEEFYKAVSGDVLEKRGKNVQPPNYDNYAVFVQSYCGDKVRGSTRKIPENARILYENPTPSNLGLTPLDSLKFKKWPWPVQTRPESIENVLRRRLSDSHEYDQKSYFFQHSHHAAITANQEVIFVEEDTNNYYKAEEKALKMIGAPGESVPPFFHVRWTVYVQNTREYLSSLKGDESILYRDDEAN